MMKYNNELSATGKHLFIYSHIQFFETKGEAELSSWTNVKNEMENQQAKHLTSWNKNKHL